LFRHRPAAGLVFVVLGAVACRESVSPPSSPEPTYVGLDACAECHAPQVTAWRGSHHDLAMQPVTEETVLGDFDDATVTAQGVTSTFFRRDGDFYVRTDGPDGSLAAFRVAYTFGVTPLQQYLIEFPRGRYQALSLCWDARTAAAGGQRWFHLYPHETIDHRDPLHWTGPQQNWNYMCAECHSTALARNYSPAEDRFDTTGSEIDVSCEACHGPGSRHVDWARHVRAGEPDSDPSRGLSARLGDPGEGVWAFDGARPTAHRTAPRASDAELETCARCHSRRGWIWEEYRPGRPLADTHRVALLDAGLYHADGQILDEVYEYGSFLQSRMHVEGVTCTDCHDPHSGRPTLNGNALCGRCHLPATFDTPEHHHHAADAVGSRCIDCHMAVRSYMVVDPRRDHSFRVPRPDLSVELGTPNACTDCHGDRDAAWAAASVARWFPQGRTGTFHYGEALHAARIGSPEAPELLLRVFDDPVQPAIVRATALEEMRSHAVPSMLAVLGRAARDASALVRRTAAEIAGELDPATRARIGAPLLDDPSRTVRLAAGASLAGAPADRLAADRLPALERAIAEYRESLGFDAFRAEAQFNLGNLERQLGRAPEAEAAYRRAVTLDATFVPAYVNLADLLGSIGRDADGARVLREALVGVPRAPDLQHALGLALARDHQLLGALEHLRAAAELSPEDARYAFVYGVALHDAGDVEGAVRVLSAARDKHPFDRDILEALRSYQSGRSR